MRPETTLAVVSWIDGDALPKSYGTDMFDEQLWLSEALCGLYATSNPRPPKTIGDFVSFKQKGDYRGLMFFKFSTVVDMASDQTSSFTDLGRFLETGPTPKFDISKVPQAWIDSDARNSVASPGEVSGLSNFATQDRNDFTAIGAVTGSVMVDGVVKVRAGSHTDDLGVKLGALYHVPWVWSEMLVTFENGEFHLVGRGSIFPTHTWYVNGNQVAERPQVAVPTIIEGHKLMKVLNKGAPTKTRSGPRSLPTLPQSPLADDLKLKGKKSPVQTHPWTVESGEQISFSWPLVWTDRSSRTR